MEMELHPLTKTRWREKCERAVKPDRYKRYIQMLLDIIGSREGIKVLEGV